MELFALQPEADPPAVDHYVGGILPAFRTFEKAISGDAAR